jgi:lipopolysaccharide/colanic/teichoic acid biosynthesis glycosyltransferase
LRQHRHRPDGAGQASRIAGRPKRDRTKRAFDVAFSIALPTVLAPLLVGLMIAVKLDSRGPVFYRCRRAGLRGREFAMLKLRPLAVRPAITELRRWATDVLPPLPSAPVYTRVPVTSP